VGHVGWWHVVLIEGMFWILSSTPPILDFYCTLDLIVNVSFYLLFEGGTTGITV
jgi:hypothetical protein